MEPTRKPFVPTLEERPSLPSPPQSEGDHTQRLRAIMRQESEHAVKSVTPRQRTTAEVIAALVSEAMFMGVIGIIALTSHNENYQLAAIVVAALKLGVNVSGLFMRGGGPPSAGPLGMLIASLLGPILRHGTHATALVVLGMSFSLMGCPGLPRPDGCTPMSTRCSPKGVPQTCSQTERWTEIGEACTAHGAVCCYTKSPYGHDVHACVPSAVCIPEPLADAGAAEASVAVERIGDEALMMSAMQTMVMLVVTQ